MTTSVRYNIPYATLHNRLHKKYIKPGFGKDSSPWISADIKCDLCDLGHGIHFPFIRDLVSNYLITNKILNRLKNNTPALSLLILFRPKINFGTKWLKPLLIEKIKENTTLHSDPGLKYWHGSVLKDFRIINISNE
ncbi:hypothetical protein BpHYR1_018827 [Brachionus plicatilis]|uniref:Uncharacterized protein n=1 Tax=Brachionus plicatilis TaxID=10195 RepID=A0A3M7QRS6_BRAPC|nr:hypothetical protein BpHYR1_018827 [Brachionus plicatilis]